LKVTVYKCNLCEQSWEPDFVFGVNIVEHGMTGLVDPEESDNHICRSCIIAIKGSLAEIEEEGEDE
jgi:hypothetical protein